jgi:hypothetical protein
MLNLTLFAFSDSGQGTDLIVFAFFNPCEGRYFT